MMENIIATFCAFYNVQSLVSCIVSLDSSNNSEGYISVYYYPHVASDESETKKFKYKVEKTTNLQLFED